MNLIRCDESHRTAWDAYVTASAQGSFYHRWGWKTINERRLQHKTAYLAAEEDGRLVGVMPIVRVKSRLFGNIACSMPFVNYGGPCSDSAEIERRLLEAAVEQCAEWGSDYLEIRSQRELQRELPCSQHKVSLTVTLDRDPETLWKAFKTGHRQEIRKAFKNGLTVKFGGRELLDPFYTVLSESWRDLGTPLYERAYFADILDTFPAATRLAVVFAESGEPAAAAFDGLHNDRVEGMWLGIRPEFRKSAAGYALYWELIKNACEAGFRTFHLGRSTAGSGAESFKKKWQAEAIPLYWYYHLRTRSDLPQLNVSNAKYQLAINVWRKLPLSVTRTVGRYVAPKIP